MNIVAAQNSVASNGALLEKVITMNDLAGLTALEKVQHIKNICESIGLNPLTKPIQLLKFQGKEIAYFTKDATEQLRKNNHVSIIRVEKTIENDICMITVYAKTPDGREDAATGAVSIANLKGDALCNAILKAETKAKRRVTLSICGLGFIDESEAESIPNARKVDPVLPDVIKSLNVNEMDNMLLDISQVSTIGELEEVYSNHYKACALERNTEGMKQIIMAAKGKKAELERQEFVTEMDEGDSK